MDIWSESAFDEDGCVRVEIYEWTELHSFINPSNVALPESSKDYITKSYTVTKVNAKGKQQQR